MPYLLSSSQKLLSPSLNPSLSTQRLFPTSDSALLIPIRMLFLLRGLGTMFHGVLLLSAAKSGMWSVSVLKSVYFGILGKSCALPSLFKSLIRDLRDRVQLLVCLPHHTAGFGEACNKSFWDFTAAMDYWRKGPVRKQNYPFPR